MDVDGKRGLNGLGSLARVHSYTKLGTTSSLSTSALRKYPHSLRHDQKTHTRLKRLSAPVTWPSSGIAARLPLHQSSPDLGVVGSCPHPDSLFDRLSRNVPLKPSDSLPHLNHRLRLLHSILPRITRTISESREAVLPRKNSGGSIWRRSESNATFDSLLQRLASPSLTEPSDDNERTSLITSPCEDTMPNIKSCVSRRQEWHESLVSLPGTGEVDHPAVTLTSADSTSRVSLHAEPIKATNRLRVPLAHEGGGTSRVCSRCSSLLSMASSSRYSINTTGSFAPLSAPPETLMLCKLCLMEVPLNQSLEIRECGCVFCRDCMRLYVEYEIQEAAYDISCPDAQCRLQGTVTLPEVETLVTRQMMDRYRRFRLNHEVDMDRNRTWCPRAGCETVCSVCPREACSPTSVHCPTCFSDFCSNCKNAWHQGLTCEENSKRLLKEGRRDVMEPGLSFNSDLIKCCPMCSVPIEKDEGCAQMMCKRCKHVFCWYCLASLDDDFLLRHYDKGPCKNKLGHSRARVIWHRTQVIGIFAGFGILLLVASPLLLLAAPCIVCCKCRVCSGGEKLDADDDLPDESNI